MLRFLTVHPAVTEEHLGFIPYFLDDSDPRGAVEQINDKYAHGGGWRDSRVGKNGFRLFGGVNYCPDLVFPGDPPLRALARGFLHRGETNEEQIVVYDLAFVSVTQPDGTFRVARLD